MKKEKLNLNELSVQSFVTKISTVDGGTIDGGNPLTVVSANPLFCLVSAASVIISVRLHSLLDGGPCNTDGGGLVCTNGAACPTVQCPSFGCPNSNACPPAPTPAPREYNISAHRAPCGGVA